MKTVTSVSVAMTGGAAEARACNRDAYMRDSPIVPDPTKTGDVLSDSRAVSCLEAREMLVAASRHCRMIQPDNVGAGYDNAGPNATKKIKFPDQQKTLLDSARVVRAENLATPDSGAHAYACHSTALRLPASRFR